MNHSEKFRSFEEFWPYYLRQHSQAGTRAFHIAGTSLAAVAILGWALTNRKSLLALALLGSYGSAWIGHGLVEHNRPATFEYPLWSLRAEALMVRLWLSGDLDRELKRTVGLPNRISP